MDVELQAVTPPELLYHGTGEKYVPSIEAQGLIPKTRLYVHLSGDYDTARKVGARHGKPRVYQVHAARMAADGYTFYRSVNGVTIYIDCITVENTIPRNMYERSELDYLVYNDPAAYADLILSGEAKDYLKRVTEYKPID